MSTMVEERFQVSQRSSWAVKFLILKKEKYLHISLTAMRTTEKTEVTSLIMTSRAPNLASPFLISSC